MDVSVNLRREKRCGSSFGDGILSQSPAMKRRIEILAFERERIVQRLAATRLPCPVCFTTETEQLLIIKQHGQRPPVWCEQCARQVRMVTPEEAAAIAGLRARHIYRQAEAGRIHLTEDARRDVAHLP